MAIIPSGGFFMQKKQGSLSRQAARHSSRPFSRAFTSDTATFPSSMTAK
nr:hypothetical protein [uncultured Akkermansia sp.]